MDFAAREETEATHIYEKLEIPYIADVSFPLVNGLNSASRVR